MQKHILLFILFFGALGLFGQNSIHSYSVETIDGKTFDFESLKGSKVLIVNTASKCGLTKQYKDLELLYKKYKDEKFVVIGFPANNFLGQEPGTDEEIKSFCEKYYGVSFPMMSKISVKGDDISPVYEFLTQKSLNGVKDSKITWNFQKYAINEKGIIEKVFSPKVEPMSERITNWIEGIE